MPGPTNDHFNPWRYSFHAHFPNLLCYSIGSNAAAHKSTNVSALGPLMEGSYCEVSSSQAPTSGFMPLPHKWPWWPLRHPGPKGPHASHCSSITPCRQDHNQQKGLDPAAVVHGCPTHDAGEGPVLPSRSWEATLDVSQKFGLTFLSARE